MATDDEQVKTPARSRFGSRTIGAVVAAALVVAFVVVNRQRVSVHFLVVSGHPELIWVMAACVALGALLGVLIRRPHRHGEERAKRD